MERSLTGVILAGGNSSRMGRQKALLELNGRPFVAHIASTLQKMFKRVILVVNDASLFQFLRLESYGDLYQNCGPLGGIHSGLIHADGADIFVCACDTPLVTTELVQHIAAFPSAASVRVPLFDQRIHPLCGIYTQECLPAIVDDLEAGHLRVLDFVRKVNAEIVPITPDLPIYRSDLFRNFNSPEDFSHEKNTN